MQYVILPRNDKVCLFHSAMTGSRHPLGKDELMHYRTPGSKNGVRLYQNKDGSLTPLGYKHYGIDPNYLRKQGEQLARAANKEWFDRQGPQVKPKPEAPRASAPSRKFTFGAQQKASAHSTQNTNQANKPKPLAVASGPSASDVGGLKGTKEQHNSLYNTNGTKATATTPRSYNDLNSLKDKVDELTKANEAKNQNNSNENHSGIVQRVRETIDKAVNTASRTANDFGNSASNAYNNVNAYAQGLMGNNAEVRRQQDMQRTGMPNNAPAALAGQAANKNINNTVGAVGNAISGAAQGVGNAVQNAWNNGVVPAAQNVGQYASGVARGLTGSPMSDNDLRNVDQDTRNGYNTARNVSNAVSGAAQDVGNFVTGQAVPAVQNAAQGVSNFVTEQAVPAVQNAAQGVGGFFGNIGNALGNAWNGATNWVGNAANDVGNWVGNAANDVSNWVGNAANDVGNWVGNAANDVGKAVSGAAQGVGNWIGNAANDVGAFATNAWNGLTGQNTYGNVAAEQLKEAAGLPNTLGGTRAGSDFANAINGAWNGVTGAATNLWNNGVVPAAQNVGQYASGVARGLTGSPISDNDLRNVDQDVRNGYNASRPVANVINNVGNAISGAAQSIGNTAQNVWNNNVVPIAQNVGQYANGFRAGYNQTGMTPELINNSKTINQNFKNGANLGNSARNVINNVGNAVSDVANGVGNTAQNVGQYASGVVRGLTGSPMRDNDLRNVDQDTRNGYNAARNVSNTVSGIPRSVADTAQNVAKGATGLYNQGVNYVNNNVVKPIQNFVSGGQQTRAAMQQALANMGYSPSFIRSLDDEGLKYVLDSMWGH